MVGVRVQHHEYVVDVIGQHAEQLLAVEQLLVLFREALAVAADDDGQQQRDHDPGDARHQQQRAGLQRIHAGIDHAGGHEAEQHPVLKARGLIDEVILFAVDGEHRCAGLAGRKAAVQRLDPLGRQVGMILQHAQKIVDVADVPAGVVDDDAAVGMDDVAAGLAVERADLQRLDQVAVAEADGDGLVLEATVLALLRRHREHHDLGLAGYDGVDHHVLALEDEAGQLAGHVQIAGLAVGGDVAPLAGDEVEVGKARLLAQRFHILPHLANLADVL